jgi:hypothetical protein
MPPNPPNFRFTGVDGRGRQTLVRDPRNGGSAVVRIDDSQGGAEGYTFDLTWGGNDRGPGYDQRGPGYPDRGDNRDRPAYRDPNDGRYGERDRINQRFTTDQAIRVCQDNVRIQAAERFNARDVDFRRTTIDDQPGRNDWVIGTFAVRRGYNRVDTYRFSCSVNFDTGRVRSTDIQPTRGWGR